MLFRTVSRLGRSPYSVFLKQYAKKVKVADFKGTHLAKIAARARALGKMYRALPAAEKKAIVAEAKAAKSFPKKRAAAGAGRRTVKAVLKTLKAGNDTNTYQFALRNYKKVAKRSKANRIAALVKLFQKKKAAKAAKAKGKK